MTFIAERLSELFRHLDHLRLLRPRVRGAESLHGDLSLHNDVLFSLLTVCQLVIDIAGELSARRGERFESYREAIQNLSRDERFVPDLIKKLEQLPGFRNVLVHEYVGLDMERVLEALSDLDSLEEFGRLIVQLERQES